MDTAFSIWELPLRPAVYAFCGAGPAMPLVFVGVAESLRRRVVEQLVLEGVSAAREGSAFRLRPDWIAELRWWQHADFDDRHKLRAGELVACEFFDPILRSRVRITEEATHLYEDKRFREAMRAVFSGPPTGSLQLHTVSLAIERIAGLERRLDALEAQDRRRDASRTEQATDELTSSS